MRLFNSVIGLRHYLSQCELSGRRSPIKPESDDHLVLSPSAPFTIGLVPTMGALHAGHLSLIDQARQDNDLVVVSIFVNPLQFGPSEDFERYPRPQQADQALCQSAGVDIMFLPSPLALYGTSQPDQTTITQVVPPQAMTATLCGRSRPGHFQGVATVVTKLLNIVRPTYAYFGQKDAQQVAILKRLSQDLHLPGEIVVCPTVREPDGLALSSRNRYLSGAERQQATALYRSLQAAQLAFRRGERSGRRLLQIADEVIAIAPAVTLDYLALVQPDTLKPLQAIETVGMMAIAAYIGTQEGTQDTEGKKTRLIDNVMLQRAPIIAIDGPAGAGKSTVARQVAHRLGLLYLDTGAMYRALTWFVLQQNIDSADEAAVAQLLPTCQIRLRANFKDNQPQPPQVQVNGQDVTQAIRSAVVTAQVSTIAAQAAVRAKLVDQQQQYGIQGGIVADGRDIGTEVFPQAELKIYLTASVAERARRRYRDLQATGQPLPDREQLAQSIAERDRQDSTRTVSPLRKAPDAIEIVSDQLNAEQVIEKISALYQQIAAQ